MISARVSCISGVPNRRGEPVKKIVLHGTRAELGTIAEGIIGALSTGGSTARLATTAKRRLRFNARAQRKKGCHRNGRMLTATLSLD